MKTAIKMTKPAKDTNPHGTVADQWERTEELQNHILSAHYVFRELSFMEDRDGVFVVSLCKLVSAGLEGIAKRIGEDAIKYALHELDIVQHLDEVKMQEALKS